MTTKKTPKNRSPEPADSRCVKNKLEAQAAQKHEPERLHMDRLTASDGEKFCRQPSATCPRSNSGRKKCAGKWRLTHTSTTAPSTRCGTELRQFADQHKQVVRIQQQTQEQQLERVNPNTASVPARSTTRRDVTAATAGRCSGGRSHHRSDSSVSRRGVVFVLT